ncbi:serine hydrolase [Sphingosinicella sp. BN140058]|uniref:serine hydrolase domain-containing protein n=1 Tax=Sphingosinicella sp. BN140058 TaxID=1892855 RepID=UPI00101317C3|nr:serine hydrolase domain-containing protein [Sphingosinicella sp. BN140058]QAY75608.1 class A beta-lactamase-related serine hydrolase [Sphingosinicella sp. BN140058]
MPHLPPLTIGAAIALATAVPSSAQPPGGATPTCAVAVQAGGPTDAHSLHVEANLRPPVIAPGERPFTLAERMRAYGVPGLSVAVIQGGRLAWARGWGVRDASSCAPVTPETAFQAASISKVATALLALRLAEHGKLALDRDINLSLRSWKLPQDPALAPRGVTLRQLLSHTAGLGVHGFPGYPSGTALPSVVQILDGAPPANTDKVRSVLPAGSQWTYSGGGYVVTQLALADVSGMPFPTLAERELLRPLGMTRSGFAQPPSRALRANIALAHVNGAPIEGGYHVYPELGPAGLWASASDLARLLIDIQAAAAGADGRRLSPPMAREMLAEVRNNWGLGPMVQGEGAARRFGHDGLNEGFQSMMVSFVARGDGVVLLTNGGDGRRLMDEVVRAIASEYGWTDLAAPPAEERQLTPDEITRAAGRFEGPGLAVVFLARPDGLYADTGGPRAERLRAISPTRFRSDERGLIIQFADDRSSLDIVEGGPPLRLVRAGEAAAAP